MCILLVSVCLCSWEANTKHFQNTFFLDNDQHTKNPGAQGGKARCQAFMTTDPHMFCRHTLSNYTAAEKDQYKKVGQVYYKNHYEALFKDI